jgi:hypothetical protein
MMSAATNERCELAVSYAMRGWRVFPLNGKVPAIPSSQPGGRGCLDATTDVVLIRSWWASYPSANVGIATGPESGLLVIDQDGPEARRAWLELSNRLGAIDTATATTGRADGGIHVYLSWPRGEYIKSHGQGGWTERVLGSRKMEVIGDGRYVVAPGSIHPETHRRYAWLTEHDGVAEMPEWLLERLIDRTPVKAAAPVRPKLENDADAQRKRYVGNLNAAFDRVARLPRGERNSELVKESYALGGLIHTGHVREYEVREALQSACSAWPIGERDVRKDHATIDRGIDAGKAAPYELPEREAPKKAQRTRHDDTRTPAEVVPLDEAPSKEDAARSAWLERDPEPLDASHELPEFPVASLPDWCAAYVEALATSVQVPADMPGVFVLGALSAAFGGRAKVEIKPGYTEGVNLYLAALSPPGTRKSPIQAACSKPLKELENELAKEARASVTRASANRRILEAKAKAAEANAARAKLHEERVAHEEAMAAAEALAEAPTPVEPRILAGDTTPEKLIELLSQHNGRLALLSGEDPIFGHLNGRYTKQPLIDPFLSAYSNERIERDRKGAARIVVENASLTIALAVQPTVIDSIAPDHPIVTRGLLDRFAIVVPRNLVGYREVDTAPMQQSIADRYCGELKRITRQMLSFDDIVTLTCSAEARSAYFAFMAELEVAKRPAGKLGSIVGWASKAEGMTARVAALLHLASSPTSLVIGASSMTKAIALMRYFAAHALIVCDIRGVERKNTARSILEWMLDRASSVSSRDIQRAHRSFDRQAITAATTVLEALGQIRKLPRKVGPSGGRPSEMWELHPRAYVGGRGGIVRSVLGHRGGFGLNSLSLSPSPTSSKADADKTDRTRFGDGYDDRDWSEEVSP